MKSMIALALLALLTVAHAESEVVTKAKACLNQEDTSAKLKCIGGVVGTELETAKKNAETLWNEGTTEIKDFLNEKKALIEQQDWFKNLQAKYNQATQAIKDKAKELKDKLEQQEWYQKLHGKVDEATQKLKDTAEKVKESAQEKAKELKEKLEKEEWYQNLHNKAEAAKGELKEKANEFKDWLSEKLSIGKREKRETDLEILGKVVSMCNQASEGNPLKTAKCLGELYGPDVYAAIKDKVSGLVAAAQQKGDQLQQYVQANFGDKIAAVKDQAKQLKEKLEKEEWYQNLHNKAEAAKGELKEKANELKDWLSEKLGIGKREKRDMPTQSEIQLAKRIKICVDMGQDKASCFEKILGDKHANVDLVKLDTIVKYEAVLEELKEFFAFKENGGTLKEFIAHKKEQNGRRKRETDLEILGKIVSMCNQASEGNPLKTAKCLGELYGPDVYAAIKDKVSGLVAAAQQKGDQLQQYVQANFGDKISAIKDQAQKLKEKAEGFFHSLFGGAN